jgi:hypothetical protein
LLSPNRTRANGSPSSPAFTSLERQLAVAPDTCVFSDVEVEGCDEPVQRYFRSAIAPGTVLTRTARLRMRGTIKVGKRWVPFRADELLAHSTGTSGRQPSQVACSVARTATAAGPRR